MHLQVLKSVANGIKNFVYALLCLLACVRDAHVRVGGVGRALGGHWIDCHGQRAHLRLHLVHSHVDLGFDLILIRANQLLELLHLPIDSTDAFDPYIMVWMLGLVFVQEPVEVLLVLDFSLPFLHCGNLNERLRLHPVVHGPLSLLYAIKRATDYWDEKVEIHDIQKEGEADE